jgi:hypothetical protein
MAGPETPCLQGGNSLGSSRAAMSEVQICGIPKLQRQGVAPAP